MDRYAAHFRRSEDDHRLSPDPSWIKLCPPEAVIPQADVMVPGMYFSRQHFERLRQDPRLHTGRGKAVRFGYANVPSYLDNTMFTRLVETGMIGTTGVSTDLVRRQITRSYQLGRMVIMGVVSGKDTPAVRPQYPAQAGTLRARLRGDFTPSCMSAPTPGIGLPAGREIMTRPGPVCRVPAHP
ncbi:hypothetical protein RB201_31525 [Streptomyces sp. S1A(2023)]